MSGNKKFLKQESLYLNKIKELFNNKCYNEIAIKRNEVFDNIDLFSKTDVLEMIITSMFYCKYFDELVSFVSELKNYEIERYDYCFYLLASLIAQNDIYACISYIKKSKLLKDHHIEGIILEDGANYSSIINEDINDIPCLLLINYVFDFDLEGSDQENLYVIKYYEMLDTIYSLGFDSEVIDFMMNIGKIIFSNESDITNN